MTIAQRLRKARACIQVAEAELIELRNSFLDHRSTVHEARVTSGMKRQLTKMAARLEDMAEHHDIFGPA